MDCKNDYKHNKTVTSNTFKNMGIIDVFVFMYLCRIKCENILSLY